MLVDVCDVVLKIRAVRDVTVNQKVWIPLSPELQPRTCLRRVGFHVISIEIEFRCCGAPAQLGGSVLLKTIEWAEAFVPVNVVDWDEESYGVLQKPCARF